MNEDNPVPDRSGEQGDRFMLPQDVLVQKEKEADREHLCPPTHEWGPGKPVVTG